MNIEKMLNSLDSESEDTTANKTWYKYTTPSGYYFSPFSKSKHILKHFEDPKEMAHFANTNDKGYDVVTDELLQIYDRTTAEAVPEELPNAVYFHEYGNSSSPERLTPMDIRDDKYVEILDSLTELDKSVEQFVQNKELYTDSCSAYKLGILLFGPPGTGKTSYLREFIRKHDAIVIFMDGVPSRKFLSQLETSTKNRLKIIVFEEAVSLLESSDDVRDMLDFLDGSRSITNAIYFLSTNYPESIPENIVRNGRIDLFVRVEFPNEIARRKLINLYLKREATDDEVAITENIPIVDIREMCFLHKKSSKTFKECAKIIEDKHKMLRKHFGKARDIRLA